MVQVPTTPPEPRLTTERPLVSIIIPHRDQLEWLGACLASCLAQTYDNIEILLIDDGSTTDPSAFLRPYGDKVHLHRLPHSSGPAAARNLGLKLARGEVIQYLDSDDYIHRRKLEVQVRRLVADKVPVVLSDWRKVDCFGLISLTHPVRRLAPTADLLAETIGDSWNWFPLMGGLFRKAFLEQVGDWRTDLAWGEDRDYRYRVLRVAPAISRTTDCFFYYRRYLKPSRATTPLRGDDSVNIIARYNCAYLVEVVEDMRRGRVPIEPARKGVGFRLIQLRKDAALCKPVDADFLRSFIRDLEKQMTDLGWPPDFGPAPLELPIPPKRGPLRSWLVRHVKPRVAPDLWRKISLVRSAVATWLGSWTNHWLKRMTP